ncbi:flagellar motor protein MotB [Sphingomonas adhaesiva]|uniref:flagellar motor protein MotB n=1 Tax=Sphingomonas adhaesiva TaxID=28212 RepID=UPI002FFD0D18
MTADDLPEESGGRALWLITLADLSLLLVGFFVLLQSQQDMDPRALAQGLAAGFGVEAPAIAVASHGVTGFAPASAELPGTPDALVAWARAELRDPRVRLTVTGATDGSAADVDPASGSATALAAERARTIVSALARAGIPDRRLDLATARAPTGRHVIVTLAFAGEQEPKP